MTKHHKHSGHKKKRHQKKKHHHHHHHHQQSVQHGQNAPGRAGAAEPRRIIIERPAPMLVSADEDERQVSGQLTLSYPQNDYQQPAGAVGRRVSPTSSSIVSSGSPEKAAPNDGLTRQPSFRKITSSSEDFNQPSEVESQIEVREPSVQEGECQSRSSCSSEDEDDDGGAPKNKEGQCKILMTDCQFYNNYRPEIINGSAKNPVNKTLQVGYDVPPNESRPGVVVEPRTDDSFSCDCRNCQFLSGWCCFPIGLIILLVIGYIWLRSYLHGTEPTATFTELGSYEVTRETKVEPVRVANSD